MSKVSLKVGDSISVVGTYKDNAGTPVDLDAAGITVTSSVLSPDGKTRHPLEVVPYDQSTDPGKFTIHGSTADWEPHKGWLWDIRYTTADDSWSSDSVTIDLAARVS